MRSHTQSVVIEPKRRRITGCISYKPLLISDLSVLVVCNKTGGTIKGDTKKKLRNIQGFPPLQVATPRCLKNGVPVEKYDGTVHNGTTHPQTNL